MVQSQQQQGTVPFKKGQSGNPRGRRKGALNKATTEMKEWAKELFTSVEWRESATTRILTGKAPHLETHIAACLMPKTETLNVPGLSEVAAALSRKLVDEFHPGPGKTA